jgi:sortase A
VYGGGPCVCEPLSRNTGLAPVVSAIVRRTAASVGRMLVTVGLLILLFVAYQLWGTGIFTARAQSKLKRQFATELQDNPTVASTTSSAPPGSTTTGTATTTTLPSSTAPKVVQVVNEGDPVGQMRIPKIGVNLIFVQGTARDDLSKGPGHYPATPMPGQLGNAAIAGHRTTHGKPFYNLNELAAGDSIIIRTTYGTFTYRVTQQLIVRPTDVSVVAPTRDAELTLTTCNPRFSARERMVVHAKLVVNKSSPARATVPLVVAQPTAKSGSSAQSSLQDSLSGDTSSRGPTFVWGAITLLVGALWWWLYRRWRHPLTWLVGIAPFLAVLFAFYVYFERLLPANF